MPRKPRSRAKARKLAADELRAQDGHALPERHAMSLLSGLPTLGDGGLMGAPTDGSVMPVDQAPAPADDTATTTDGRDIATYSPVNRADATNQLSNGATQGTTSSQTAPITQTS